MTSVSFFTPIKNKDKPEQHTAQVGKVGNVVATAAAYTHKQLYDAVADNKIFRLDGDGHEHEEKLGIRKHHAESQQYAEYGARRSDGDDVVEHEARLLPTDYRFRMGNGIAQRKIPCKLLHQSGAYARRHVEKEKSLAAPHRLDGTAEHIDREHIEKHVGERGRVVQEHIGYELRGIEAFSSYIVQPEIIDQIDLQRFFENDCRQPHQQIYDNQVFSNRRNRIEEISSFLKHNKIATDYTYCPCKNREYFSSIKIKTTPNEKNNGKKAIFLLNSLFV